MDASFSPIFHDDLCTEFDTVQVKVDLSSSLQKKPAINFPLYMADVSDLIPLFYPPFLSPFFYRKLPFLYPWVPFG